MEPFLDTLPFSHWTEIKSSLDIPVIWPVPPHSVSYGVTCWHSKSELMKTTVGGTDFGSSVAPPPPLSGSKTGAVRMRNWVYSNSLNIEELSSLMDVIWKWYKVYLSRLLHEGEDAISS